MPCPVLTWRIAYARTCYAISSTDIAYRATAKSVTDIAYRANRPFFTTPRVCRFYSLPRPMRRCKACPYIVANPAYVSMPSIAQPLSQTYVNTKESLRNASRAPLLPLPSAFSLSPAFASLLAPPFPPPSSLHPTQTPQPFSHAIHAATSTSRTPQSLSFPL